VLEPGDRLLCFGKLEWMRDLIPAKIRRTRRPAVRELPDLPVADESHPEDAEPSIAAESSE
jgi:ribosomal protein S6--L-glutamate ligase